MQKKKILVTAALPYANGPIHLGHLAGAYLTPDLYVRYKRLKGDDIVFICGSDEHGVPITIAAEKEGVQPQDIVDRYHEMNKQVFEDLESRSITMGVHLLLFIMKHHKKFLQLYIKKGFSKKR